MRRDAFGMVLGLAAALVLGGPAARAESAPASSPWTFEARDTAEFWSNLRGGLSTGGTTLNKLQASARFTGEAVGWRGFSAYAQAFRTNAQSLSLVRTGDTQTASNIEAVRVERLFELWAEQDFGAEDSRGWVSFRAGLIDLNRTFDSIPSAGLFLNSSHGIGPDLSHSGPIGPSIFPITAPAVQADWRPANRLVLHLGAFADPDPRHVANFADLSARGGLLIAQADVALGADALAAVAVWRHSEELPSYADPSRSLRPRPGAYVFVEGPAPLPGRPRGWVRAGFADGRIQDVAGYLGGGIMWNGASVGRGGDQFGVAVAHARLGGAARASGLPAAETSFEASYSLRVGRFLHLQPDVQYIVHPAAAPGLKNATAVGLRVVAFAAVGDND